MNPAGTHNLLVIPQDHQSIFGDTVHGVPSPTIPHEHPYPTRFHGPIYHYPRFYLPYREQSYVVPPEYTGPGLVPKWPENIPFGAVSPPWSPPGVIPPWPANLQEMLSPKPIIGQTCPGGWTYRNPRKTSGFGAEGPPLLGSATGSGLVDAILGGAIGYAVAKDPKDRMLWAGGGAAAGLLAGTLGLLGLVGVAVWVRQQ
jgi:hypothetical protein